MYPAQNNMPTPIGTIEELLQEGDNTSQPHKVFIGHNLGHRTFLAIIPMYDFFRISDVANERRKQGEQISQRKLDIPHATKLAIYLLKGLVSAAIEKRKIQKKEVPGIFEEVQQRLGKQPYMALQPLVCNLRESHPGGTNIPGQRMTTAESETACFKIMLSQKDILWVVDGQHRRKAMEIVFDFLNNTRTNHSYPKKNSLYPYESQEISDGELELWAECDAAARGYCTIPVEIHLGLDIDQERQLFHDLNNLAKKVEASLALQFDNSNPVNVFIKEELMDDILDWNITETDQVNWDDDDGSISRKQFVAINALLFLNKTNISGATPPKIEPMKESARRFWKAVSNIPNLGQSGAKVKTIAAQPVVLKALAKLCYDFSMGRKSNPDHLEKLLAGIPSINFSHTNPMWRYYTLSEEERQKYDIAPLKLYLPPEGQGANRDVGVFDEKNQLMRFGAKHNDIVPLLGDMIRWTLGLPGRQDGQLSLVAGTQEPEAA